MPIHFPALHWKAAFASCLPVERPIVARLNWYHVSPLKQTISLVPHSTQSGLLLVAGRQAPVAGCGGLRWRARVLGHLSNGSSYCLIIGVGSHHECMKETHHHRLGSHHEFMKEPHHEFMKGTQQNTIKCLFEFGSHHVVPCAQGSHNRDPAWRSELALLGNIHINLHKKHKHSCNKRD